MYVLFDPIAEFSANATWSLIGSIAAVVAAMMLWKQPSVAQHVVLFAAMLTAGASLLNLAVDPEVAIYGFVVWGFGLVWILVSRAGVGVGGKGWSDIAGVSKGQKVVALCDVDRSTLDKAAQQYPGAKTYADWRKLLEQGDIDAAVGARLHLDFETAVSEMTHLGDTFDPDPKERAIYDGLYHEVYLKMYKRLRPLYEKIRSITGYPS